VLLAGHCAHAAPACDALGYNNIPAAKPNKLYLYFPAADDTSFPEFGAGGPATSPGHHFDSTELTSYTGTPDELMSAIFDVVTDDFCEFNVEVVQVAGLPTSAAARRNVVAVGTDGASDGTYGLAQNVDTGDTIGVDFARVWAGTYQLLDGNAGGALNGAKSTVERWANSIGGTAAHEAGHNFGLTHHDGVIVAPGEDALTRHLMADGIVFSPEQRAGFRRHFSDHEYSILAANVGLSVQTMCNWDFANPNAEVAKTLRMDFLSVQPSLTLASVYTGNRSPWTTPTVSASLGTQTFKGTTYHRYQITWSTGQAWLGGGVGEVPGGGEFHVGASFNAVDFNTPDPIIITNVDLLDADGAVLALHPRTPGFDSGTLDRTGMFSINAFNFQREPLVIERVTAQFLPRWLSIDAMVPGVERLVDPFGMPVTPWNRKRIGEDRRADTVRPGGQVRIPIARVRDGRNIVERIGPRECGTGDIRGGGRDTLGCVAGISVDLFPATATYVIASVVDPKARHWDPGRAAYVSGPLRATVYFQVLGRRLNGVIDNVQRRPN
jgi:hypothetical protein